MPLVFVPDRAAQAAKAVQAADPLYKKIMNYKSNYYDQLEQKHKEFTVSLGGVDIQNQHDSVTLYSYNEHLHVTFQMINDKFEELTDAKETPSYVLERLIVLTQRLLDDFSELFRFVDRYGLAEDIKDKDWGFGMDVALNIMALKDIKEGVNGKRVFRRSKSSRKSASRNSTRHSNNRRENHSDNTRKKSKIVR